MICPFFECKLLWGLLRGQAIVLMKIMDFFSNIDRTIKCAEALCRGREFLWKFCLGRNHRFAVIREEFKPACDGVTWSKTWRRDGWPVRGLIDLQMWGLEAAWEFCTCYGRFQSWTCRQKARKGDKSGQSSSQNTLTLPLLQNQIQSKPHTTAKATFLSFPGPSHQHFRFPIEILLTFLDNSTSPSLHALHRLSIRSRIESDSHRVRRSFLGLESFGTHQRVSVDEIFFCVCSEN